MDGVTLCRTDIIIKGNANQSILIILLNPKFRIVLQILNGEMFVLKLQLNCGTIKIPVHLVFMKCLGIA